MQNTPEIQEKPTFEQLLENTRHRPNGNLVRMINNNSHPFFTNNFFSYNPAKLSSTEWNRCVRTYIERGQNGSAMDAMMIMQELMQMEAENCGDLEDLAIELVKEMYNVPDSLNLRALLNRKDDDEEEQSFDDQDNVEPDAISTERKIELLPHIQKRRILNSIVHGAAIYQWTSAYYIVADKLNDINPELLPRYNKLSALVNYWNWMFVQADMMQMGGGPVVQGSNDVDHEKQEVKGRAINFPVLIHELSKGVLDYICSVGIPSDLPPHELQYVYDEADKYSHEQWHYIFGPTLWLALLNSADVTSHDLPPIISVIAQMDYEELSDFCIDICFHPETTGKNQMLTIKKQAEELFAEKDEEEFE